MPPPPRHEQVATTAAAATAASCRGLPGGCGGKAARLAARGSDSPLERPRHHVSESSCRVTPPASLDFNAPLRPRGPWSQLNVSDWKYRLDPKSYNTSEQAVLDAIWASQFRDECDRLLLFEDDMRGAGLGFASAIIGNLLLYAFVMNRVLLEVPTNGSWHGVRNHMPYNENRKPSTHPRWCDAGPRTHQCYYQRLSHCVAPPAHEHVPPHLGNQAHIRNNHKLNAATRAMRVKLTWAFKTAGNPGAHWPSFDNRALSAARRFLWRPRAWVRRIGDCVMGAHGLQPRHGARPANFVSIFIRESVEKDAELRKYKHGVVPRRVWPEVSRRVAARLGVRRVFVQTSSEAALAWYAAAAAPLGLRVSHTNNSRSAHDEWGGWSNRSGVLNHQGAVAAVNAYVASQAAALLSPTQSSWTDLLADMLPPSKPETALRRAAERAAKLIHQPGYDTSSRHEASKREPLTNRSAAEVAPPMRLWLCCRCTPHDGGGDLGVLLPRERRNDAGAAALLRALGGDFGEGSTASPCRLGKMWAGDGARP